MYTKVLLLLALALASSASAQTVDVAKQLDGFDDYMAKVLKDWNGPGIGVGIVVGDKLVFAKGYGYRDYGKKLPFTAGTVCPIASNTKLFTAVAAGMLVEEGKLTWDQPIRDSVPAIRFYNEQLNNSVTLRDMLSHRTGITRHDTIWIKIRLHSQRIVRSLAVSGTAGPDPAGIPLQQPDVCGCRLCDRVAVREAVGAIRA